MLLLAALVLAPRGESILVVDNAVVGYRAEGRWHETDVDFAMRHKTAEAFRVFGVGTVDKGPVFYGFEQSQSDGPTFVSGEDANGEASDRKPMLSGFVPRVPRRVTTLPLGAAYRSIAQAWAGKRGYRTPNLRLTGAFRADLDGDGAQEVLLSATSGKPGGEGWTKGAYSFVLLRAVGRKGLVQTALELSSAPKGGVMDEKRVRAVADLDGDGRMEVLTTGVAAEFVKATLWAYRAGVAKRLVEGAAAS